MLPYFIDELTVVDIDLGNELPVVRRAGKPYLNNRGFWVDLDIAYSGGFVMALETKVNLLKLKEKPRIPTSSELRQMQSVDEMDSSSSSSLTPGGLASSPSPPSSPQGQHHRLRAAYTEEEEDSAESSTDSEAADEIDGRSSQVEDVADSAGGVSGGGTSRRLMRLVDRISKSRYFHRALDNKYIQRGMEYVSNTRLVLQVEVQLLSGSLAINLPPPPSDRLWYGFRTNPVLKLNARPKVGAKEVTMARITDWIEHKLALEFQRVVVMPNMDDLIIPLLSSGSPENYGHNLH